MTDETKNDGGPAFPAEGGSDSGLHANPGMTLRDYFAIHADLSKMEFNSMPALVEFLGEDVPDDVNDAHVIGMGARANAKLRYILADAMIAERSK